MRNVAARAVALLLALALHIAFFMVAIAKREREATETPALILIDVASRSRPRPKDSLSKPANQEQVLPRAAARAPSRSTDVSPSVQQAPSTAIDWNTAAQSAAAAAVGKIIQDESYQALGPREPTFVDPPPPPSIFEAPRRKAGDIDSDGTQGSTMIWHGENCFTELKFPTIKDKDALPGAPNPPRCMFSIGEREPRGDLFDHLRKDRPLPDEKKR